MSDTTAAPAAPTPAETAKPDVKAPAQETDWKAEARKWEARAKENSDAAKRLAEIEEASKTDLEKALARAEAAEAKVKEHETREQVAAWKAEVAEATGIPAAALAGSTKEELEAHAATLKSLIPAQDEKKGAVGPYVPPEGTASGGGLGTTGDAFAAAVESALNN